VLCYAQRLVEAFSDEADDALGDGNFMFLRELRDVFEWTKIENRNWLHKFERDSEDFAEVEENRSRM